MAAGPAPAGLGGAALVPKHRAQPPSRAHQPEIVPQEAGVEDEQPFGTGASGSGGPGLPGMMTGQAPLTPALLLQQMKQRLAASPLAQKAMADPGFMQSVLAANPAMSALIEGNPRLKAMITSPDALQGMISGDTERMQGALGDSADMQQHLQTAASLNAYAAQLRAQKAAESGGGPPAEPSAMLHASQGFAQGLPPMMPFMAPGMLPVNGAAAGFGLHPGQAAGSFAPPALPLSTLLGGASFGAGPSPSHPPHQQGHPGGCCSHHPPSHTHSSSHSLGPGSSHWAADPETSGGAYRVHQPGEAEEAGLDELRRRALLPWADAAFPPLYMALAGALLWSRVLPLWALLPVLPVLFVSGIFVVVTKGGGVPSKHIPGSRMIGSLFFSLELVTVMVVGVTILPALPQYWAANVVSVSLIAVALALHAWLLGSSPGYAPLPWQYPDGVVPPMDTHMGGCDECRILRPLRSKHCHVCKRCTLHMDHHCPVVNTCVGAHNAKQFLTFMSLMLPAQLIFLAVGPAYFRAAAPSWWAAASLHPAQAILYALQVPLTMGNAFLVVRMLLCIAGNLHTAELLRWELYSYMRNDVDGSFENLFDQGPAANCLQFWGTRGALDWGPVYQEQWKVRQTGQHPPWFSVTTLLRARHRCKARAQATRARLRAQREGHAAYAEVARTAEDAENGRAS